MRAFCEVARWAGGEYPFLNMSLPMENALCACRGGATLRAQKIWKSGDLVRAETGTGFLRFAAWIRRQKGAEGGC